ncbi:sensor histidine kinase/response regulator [Aspergillus flavus]|uniref:Sensor histidine kinase/response regulator n=1 Tax=Aspergillus flavus TaxID=5059 RepID=A0AB74CEQ5_ASPFL|nr:sensor histidine kinase/response regulator [Aspergillus flavus]
MRAIQFLAFLACLSTVSAFSGRHAAHHGLLQIPPSFAHDDIHMYPALHPEHDPNYLRHLTPEDSQDLYYSQEGHRPALHGAKHGEYRSFFIASQPAFEGNCVTVLAELTDEQEEIQEAKLNWGTYQRPDIAKMQNLMAFDRLDGTGNIMSGGMSDLTKDAAAVKNFFGTDSINTDIPDEYEIGLDYLSDSEYDKTGGGKLATDLGSALGGTQTGFALSKPGAAVQMECKSCGAKANFSFGGELAFSISKGIYRVEVSFINHEDFVFDAIYGITVDAKAFKEGSAKGGFQTTIEKELFALPFYAIKIPKFITIGPQAVVNTAASFYVDVHGEFRAASGFTPHIEPIFELKGKVVATADLALPVGVEVALDILGGTWKKSVGVYTAPSIYFTAGVSSGEGHACNNGVKLRAGAKNRIYSSALGIWNEFKELDITFYETGLGCLSAKGWNATQVEPTTTLFNNVAATFGGQENLASNTTFNLTKLGPIIYEDEHFQSKSSKDDKNKLRKLLKTNGFPLIQDAGQTSTLVSGKDGRIYLANNSAEYDISAPWGALEVDKNIFSYDVFGRLIWFDAERIASGNDKRSTTALPYSI